jgi:carbamate kinase
MRIESPIVVALGGNAISRPDQVGDIPQQFENTRRTARHLADLIESGGQVLITHGNGPQVGHVLRCVELAARELYRLPLEICGAYTQGGMGYMIAQCLRNELQRRGIRRDVTALVTSVEVDPADPAFQNPTKPIGSFYRKDKAEELAREYGWKLVSIPRHGYRRVVPSPLPKAIVEIELIRRLAQAGELLIVAGGGGIPVVRDAEGNYRGIEAVIDKDRTAGLLAAAVQAATLVIVTNVDHVAVNYQQPNERPIDRMTTSQARQYLAEGHFPAGSMGPKIEAAVDFLENSRRPDAVAVICGLEKMIDALQGRSGTWIVKDN